MPPSRERARYQDLLAIATDLFASRGYERTTVRELADAMGIESGSLYSHISSKEWRKLPEHVRTEIAGLRKQYEETFEGVIRAGAEEGAFGRVDPHWGALVVLSTLNWTFEWYSPDGQLSADEVADRLVDVVLSGLRRTPA